MRVVEMHSRPIYKLMKQSDTVSFYPMQMPRWLFFASKYKALSLEAKVAYTFLLNRFQLSKMNGWVNKEGEVFIIYTREKMAEEMGISYRKSIACFKELLAAGLIWEQRIGRGKANHIYMAAVALSGEGADAYNNAPFEARSAESACPEVPFLHSSKKEISKKDKSYIEKVSQSCSAREASNRPIDSEKESKMLQDILDNSELDVLPENEVGVFRNAITRLFYSIDFHVGSAVLPQEVIRSHLSFLDGMIVLDTREKLRANQNRKVKNSTTYVMTALFNNIWEYKSDLMVDPYLNMINST